MRYYAFIFIFLQLLSSCAAQSQDYVHMLEDDGAFNALQREPLSSKYAEVKAVKLVYELETEKIYFLSARYNYHHEFCLQELNCNCSLAIFNRDNYGTNAERRNYLLANLNYHRGLDLYFMDLSASDKMSTEDIEFLREKVIDATFLNEDLALLLNSARLVDAAKDWKTSFQLITPEYIYSNQSFQAVSAYERTGFLKKVDIDSLESTEINPQDIVLLNGTPLYLSGVSGAITTDLQTPLSHLSILGQNRKVPVMALKNAWENDSINSLVGQWVNLKVSADGYDIALVEAPESEKANSKRRSLKRNLSINELVDVRDFDRKTANYCGYKAENFGILYEMSLEYDFSVPESAFGIPFYFYQQHAELSGAQSLINKIYFTEKNKEQLLKEIQNTILSAPIHPELLKAVEEKIISLGDFKRMRFRSSTNAEDMKGFSGAGLYDSKTGELGNPKKSIELAIKTVWASLWNVQAYRERSYFNLKQEECAMGVLVHRSFPNEEVNGVAITTNIYRPNNLGFVVNAQLGEASVVQPDPSITCDQIVCYPSENAGFYSENPTIEIITTSSLNNNELVMSKEEFIHLANMLEVIKKQFYYRDFTSKTYVEYGLDIEFKLDAKTRKLYIKQVRPFNS